MVTCGVCPIAQCVPRNSILFPRDITHTWLAGSVLGGLVISGLFIGILVYLFLRSIVVKQPTSIHYILKDSPHTHVLIHDSVILE